MRGVIADIITSLKPEKEGERKDTGNWYSSGVSLVNQCRKCWQTEKRCRSSKVKAKWKMTTKAQEEWITRLLCDQTAEKDNNLMHGSLLHRSPPSFNTSTAVSQYFPPPHRHWLIGDLHILVVHKQQRKRHVIPLVISYCCTSFLWFTRGHKHTEPG